jgi:glutathione S-transferase
MKLYFSPGACSLASHIVAREAGLPLDLEKVDLKTKRTASGGNYLDVTDKGYVPALQLGDGKVLTEGSAVMQYLADQNPGSGLAPRFGEFERYQFIEGLHYLSTELHKTLGALFNRALSEEGRAPLLEKVGKQFDRLSSVLAGQPYFLGNHFTAADAYLFTILNWCGWVGIDLGKWPVLKDYHGKIGARPNVKAALAAEGL